MVDVANEPIRRCDVPKHVAQQSHEEIVRELSTIRLPWNREKGISRGGEEEDGQHSRDVGRVQEQLESPSETDDHLGLLLNLPEEARRRTVNTAGTVAKFKNLFQEHLLGPLEKMNLQEKARRRTVRTSGTLDEFKNSCEEDDGPNIRDVGRVQEQLESPSATDDHLGLLLNLPEEARRRTVNTAGTVAKFKNLGEEEDGPNIRDVGRVQEQLESPSATDDHLGLLLNLPEEARRRTVNTAGTVAKFKNLTSPWPPRKTEPAGKGEEDGPNIRDVGRVQEQLESPSETDDHLGLLLNLPEELESPSATDDHLGLLMNLPEEARRRTVNTAGTVAKFKNLF
ncbi:hypothetical protein quinque_011888 [Culex quinquefasciatus]